jgi:subtilase family serine protease
VQWAHVIAPQAKILLVEAASSIPTDLLNAVDVAVANGANVVSMSFGNHEFSSELTEGDPHFDVPNVLFVAASGDSGHGAFYPAASPKVVSIGGTTLSITSDGTYLGETAWSGSGGGASRFEPRPTYQAGVQTLDKRAIPDVAMDADPATGVPMYDTIPVSGQSGWFLVGGTSLGAPMWAALFAVVDGSRLGLGKSALGDAHTPIYTSLFVNLNDVASGTNGGCPRACNAVPGYDKVTGLGSPVANQLIPALVSLP